MITKGIVVAVGGNALIRDKHQISVESQSASIQESSRCIAALVDAGYTPVITHGNGPQVGFLLRRAELALDELPALPLDVLGADTQGATGYLFTRNLRGCLAERGIDRQVVAVVTQSLVDPDDPAFAEPSKPIGSFMDEAEAREHERKDGWVLREDSGRLAAAPRHPRAARHRLTGRFRLRRRGLRWRRHPGASRGHRVRRRRGGHRQGLRLRAAGQPAGR